LAFSSSPDALAFAVPSRTTIPYHWRDTWGARLGGDYRAIRDKLSLRVGLSYESRAVPDPYMNIDAWPVEKLGLHFGATLAVGRVRVSLAYAHLFYQSVEVRVGQGQVREPVSQNPAAAQAVNEGSYHASLDILSLQTNIAF
jgi:long-subunit fatty acid transport protein